MKKMALLFVVFFAASALAIGFQTDKTGYQKLEAIKISGSCTQGVPAKLFATSGRLQIFSIDIECKENGSFETQYQTSFLDHSGEWALELNSSSEKTAKTISVNEIREAGFYIVRFQSPTEGTYQRNQALVFSVEVIDAGTRISDAAVVAWGAKGEKIQFKNNGNGQYVLEYKIPLDAPIGDWKPEVRSQAKKGEGMFGGIGKLNLQIEPATILVEINEPKVSSFEQGDKINFGITAKYADGSPLSSPVVSLTAGETAKNFEQITLDNFKADYTVPPNASGASEIQVTAKDFAENTGAAAVKIVVSCSATCLIRQYGLMAAAIILVTAALARIFYKNMSLKGKKEQLKKEEEKINNLIKDLQKDYFTKGVMPADSYKKNLSEYKSRSVQIEQELLELKRKEQAE